MLQPNCLTTAEIASLIEELVVAGIDDEKKRDAESLAKLDPEQRAVAIDRGTKILRHQLDELSRQLLASDVAGLHRWSRMIRRPETERLFAALLGVPRPKTQKELVARLEEYLGDAWTDHVETVRRQHDDERANRIAMRAAAEKKLALSRQVKAAPLGGGVVRVISIGELIDELAAAGWQPTIRRRGICSVCDMASPDGRRRMTFDRKIEVAYCQERASAAAIA